MYFSGVPWWVCTCTLPSRLTTWLGKLTLLTRYVARAIASKYSGVARVHVLDAGGHRVDGIAPDDPDAAHVRHELARLLVDRARVARVAAEPVRAEDREVAGRAAARGARGSRPACRPQAACGAASAARSAWQAGPPWRSSPTARSCAGTAGRRARSCREHAAVVPRRGRRRAALGGGRRRIAADGVLVARHDPGLEDGRLVAVGARGRDRADARSTSCSRACRPTIAVNVEVKTSLEDALRPRDADHGGAGRRCCRAGAAGGRCC